MVPTLQKKNVMIARCPLIEEGIENKGRGTFWFPSRKTEIVPLFTFYYPYTFYEWKVTVPRYLFRDMHALIRIGVNGLTGLAAQTEMWPETDLVTPENDYFLHFSITAETADQECNRALENYVHKSLRPVKPPKYVCAKRENIYLPYHVYFVKQASKRKFIVEEALTNVISDVEKMKGIKDWIVQTAKNTNQLDF